MAAQVTASKKDMPFLITGRGRSGTKFLSSLMNRSRVWTVEHEPRRDADLRDPGQFDYAKIFRGHYGEVNSYLRNQIEHMDFVRRGIILRNPFEIMLSAMNRKPREKWVEISRGITDTYLHFDRLLEARSYHLVSFHRMTTELDYLQQILHDFGIGDVSLSSADLSRKVNVNQKNLYRSLNEAPQCIEALLAVEFMITKYDLKPGRP